jgi:hypothetical protein
MGFDDGRSLRAAEARSAARTRPAQPTSSSAADARCPGPHRLPVRVHGWPQLSGRLRPMVRVHGAAELVVATGDDGARRSRDDVRQLARPADGGRLRLVHAVGARRRDDVAREQVIGEASKSCAGSELLVTAKRRRRRTLEGRAVQGRGRTSRARRRRRWERIAPSWVPRTLNRCGKSLTTRGVRISVVERGSHAEHEKDVEVSEAKGYEETARRADDGAARTGRWRRRPGRDAKHRHGRAPLIRSRVDSERKAGEAANAVSREATSIDARAPSEAPRSIAGARGMAERASSGCTHEQEAALVHLPEVVDAPGNRQQRRPPLDPARARHALATSMPSLSSDGERAHGIHSAALSANFNKAFAQQ